MLENLNPARIHEAPKDFRPALEFDGELGSATLPAIPANEVPNFDEFLLEQGFSPDEYEIVGSPRTSRWQKYDGDWLTSYRFNFRKINNLDINLPLAWRTAKATSKRKPKAKVEGKALVIMISDFQIGKTDSRGGHAEQLERIFNAYDNLEKQIKTGYEQVIIADLGDIVEGFGNKADLNQLATNSLSIMNQVDVSISLVWDLIKRANTHCNKVSYVTVASNHCQNRISKQQVGLPGEDDWGVFIAKAVDKLAKETGIEVRVLIPQPSDESLALDVFGDNFHVLGLWHGHQSARPEAVPSWWEKQAFGNQPVAAATIGLTGHFHHLRVQELGQAHNGGSRYWIQAKTMDNGSSWYRLNSGSESQPGITCFELEQSKHFTGSVFNV